VWPALTWLTASVQSDPWARRDHKVQPARRGRWAQQDRLDHREHRDRVVPQVRLALKALWDRLGQRDHRDRLVPRVRLVLKVPQARQDRPDRLVQQDHRDHQAQATRIPPPSKVALP
jgi:hypothetical protein